MKRPSANNPGVIGEGRPRFEDVSVFDPDAPQRVELRTKVILSITLTEDVPENGSPEACHRWLASFPLPTRDVKVEAVYQSLSTVVLVSIPVETWDLLPEIPGCHFVCFANSENLLLLSKETNGSTTSSAGSSVMSPVSVGTGPEIAERYLAEKSNNLPGKEPRPPLGTKIN